MHKASSKLNRISRCTSIPLSIACQRVICVTRYIPSSTAFAPPSWFSRSRHSSRMRDGRSSAKMDRMYNPNISRTYSHCRGSSQSMDESQSEARFKTKQIATAPTTPRRFSRPSDSLFGLAIAQVSARADGAFSPQCSVRKP